MSDRLSLRPILVCDVDGCLNPCPFNPTTTRDWVWEPQFTSDEPSGSFPLNLSREMADAITALNCDLRWLTTWGHHAHRNMGARFGWPQYPVAAGPGDPGLVLPFGYWKHTSLWKPRAVFDLLAEPGPPVVWIDDDIRGYLDINYEDLLGRELDPHDRLLAVAPVYDTGITRMHLEMVREWLAGRGFEAKSENVPTAGSP